MANNDNAMMLKITGYNDVAPAEWLENYAIFANSKGWNPKQTLNNVTLYLSDDSYRQAPFCDDKKQFAELTSCLQQKYMQHDGLTWALRAELSERKQAPLESVEDYAEDIER